ncbi:MAG TPA: hypothetical protein VFT66_08445 [Roseiflexaceae bacterium]|nr:hypothetical protein [Roseiflexaceae bacterium]
MQPSHRTSDRRTCWLRRSTVVFAFITLAAAMLHIQSLPRSYAAAAHAEPATPGVGSNAAAARPNALQPRLYLPLLRQSQATTVAPTATPRPTTVSQPPATAMPMPPGEMEPVAPDWVAACPADTVPFEAQGWWMNDFGHVHLGFCAPADQHVSGSYTFKVHLTLHNNPGKITLLQAQIDDSHFVQTDKVGVTCPVDQTCSWDDEVTIDTSDFPNDGWHHLRVRATVREPDGNELVATNFIPVYLSNGKPVADFRYVTLGGTTDYIAGRGWYTNVNYTWSAVFSPPKAQARISGVYNVTVRPMATDNPQPVSRFIVKLDSTHTDPGVTIYDTTSSETKPVALSIDTTQLTNGWHSLLARTEAGNQASTGCAQCSGEPQIHAGTTKVWFYVQN